MKNTYFKSIFEEKGKLLFAIAAIFILAVGIFLRTYHFRDWLYFYPDQARDVMITEGVLNGSQPVPLMGAIAASTQFKIGPMYYYFQIISGRIFGVRPETMAYPDLLFGILTIPLFYFFLKRYFNQNLSLALTGIFSISFFAIKYSRFAWNSNPVPFFFILFFISLLEFIEKKEKASWKWVLIAGISLGVGIQLHTIMFVLMPMIAFVVFVYLIIKNRKIWKSGLLVLLIALILNAGQITSEVRNNFHNTRLLFNISAGESQNADSSFLNSLKIDSLCHVQANSYMISSLGDREDCNFSSILSRQKMTIKNMTQWPTLGIYASMIFSIFGYLCLIYNFFREKNERKKYFLGLTVLVIVLSYFVLFIVADSLLLRYFIHLFFVPFLFVGFFIEYIRKCPKIIYGLIIITIFSFLLISNIFTIRSEVEAYFSKVRSNSKYVVLGEIEPMADYIISHTSGHEAYLTGGKDYFWNYYKPLAYICSERGFNLLRGEKLKKIPAGASLYAVNKNANNMSSMDDIYNLKITDYENLGNLGIYKLENQ